MDDVPRMKGKEEENKKNTKSTAIYRQAAAKEAKHRQRAAGEGSRRVETEVQVGRSGGACGSAGR